MAQPILGGDYYVQYEIDGHNTVNDHLNRMAHGPFPIVPDKDETDPTAISPSAGDCYYVASGGTDDWLGHDGELAMYYDGGWIFRDLQDGEIITVLDEGTNAAYYVNDAGTLRQLTTI